MATAGNPYAPPTARVSDVDNSAGTQPLRWSTYHGRIGRLRYLAWLCGGYLLIGLLGVLGGAVSMATGSDIVTNVVVGGGSVIMMILWVFWTIQRSHDMGWTGWSWLWTLIPLVVLVWVFNGGTRGPNEYGPPPPPNTLGVHLLAWLLPFIFVLGIVAAVAIPAYQVYSMKAKAVQVPAR